MLDKEYLNPGAYQFNPGKTDDGTVIHSSGGIAFNLDELSDEEENTLGGLFTDCSQWLESNKDMVDVLHRALCALPDTQRQAIDLLFFQKMSFRDAGKVIGIQASSVHERFTNAVKALQQHFQNTP